MSVFYMAMMSAHPTTHPFPPREKRFTNIANNNPMVVHRTPDTDS